MRTISLIVLAGLAVAPAVASAETGARDDIAYCRALSDIYLRHIGGDDTSPKLGYKLRANLDAQAAVAQCRAGDAAAAIPVLERELIANKFTLPRRG